MGLDFSAAFFFFTLDACAHNVGSVLAIAGLCQLEDPKNALIVWDGISTSFLKAGRNEQLVIMQKVGNTPGAHSWRRVNCSSPGAHFWRQVNCSCFSGKYWRRVKNGWWLPCFGSCRREILQRLPGIEDSAW
jgi:hypothetical protein